MACFGNKHTRLPRDGYSTTVEWTAECWICQQDTCPIQDAWLGHLRKRFSCSGRPIPHPSQQKAFAFWQIRGQSVIESTSLTDNLQSCSEHLETMDTENGRLRTVTPYGTTIDQTKGRPFERHLHGLSSGVKRTRKNCCAHSFEGKQTEMDMAYFSTCPSWSETSTVLHVPK